MKKGIFLVALLFITIVSFGQKIKVKKGKILIDKKPVAHMVTDDYVTYKVSSLDESSNNFSIKSNSVVFNNADFDMWLEYSSPNSEFVNTQNLIFTKSFQSPKNAIASMLYQQGILTKSGIDSQVLNEFFSIQRDRRISDKTKEKYEKLAALENFKPYIDKDNIIYKGGKDGVRVGSIKKGKGYMEFKDIKDNVIANYDMENKKIHYAPDGGSQFLFTGNAKEAVDQLILRGATFGNQKEEYLEKKRLEEIATTQKRIEDSANINWQAGVLTDKDGKEYPGEIFIKFEEINKEEGVVDVGSVINSLGHVAKVRKSKGEKKIKFKANEGAKVCLENGDCYLGVYVDGAFGLSKKGSYLKIVEDTDQYILLASPLYSENYSLLIKGKENAFNLNKFSKKKLQKLFNEYLECEMDAKQYDTKTQAGVEKFLNDYTKKCN